MIGRKGKFRGDSDMALVFILTEVDHFVPPSEEQKRYGKRMR